MCGVYSLGKCIRSLDIWAILCQNPAGMVFIAQRFWVYTASSGLSGIYAVVSDPANYLRLIIQSIAVDGGGNGREEIFCSNYQFQRASYLSVINEYREHETTSTAWLVKYWHCYLAHINRSYLLFNHPTISSYNEHSLFFINECFRGLPVASCLCHTWCLGKSYLMHCYKGMCLAGRYEVRNRRIE